MPATPHLAVHLECPVLPLNSRIQADVRFSKSHERAMGGPDAVVGAHAGWTSAADEGADERGSEVVATVQRWQRAADAARRAGRQDGGEAEEVCFEVRLVEPAERDA